MTQHGTSSVLVAMGPLRYDAPACLRCRNTGPNEQTGCFTPLTSVIRQRETVAYEQFMPSAL